MEYRRGDKVLVIRERDVLSGFMGIVSGVVRNMHGFSYKIKFDFTNKIAPVPRDWARYASNIQYRDFGDQDLIPASKICVLLYG